MFKIAIVEDEENYQKLLQGYIKEYEELNQEKFSIKLFSQGLDIIVPFISMLRL